MHELAYRNQKFISYACISENAAEDVVDGVVFWL